MDLNTEIPLEIDTEIRMDPMDLSNDLEQLDPIENVVPFAHMDWLWDLYLYTHIIPSQADFLSQINNYDHVYLFLYWNKFEHLYLRFIEEEMDLEAIVLMRAEDFAYFGMG